MNKSSRMLNQIFLGEDNEKLTDELINELLKTGEFDEKMLRTFQKQGYTYCRPRKSFISGLQFIGR